VKPLGSDGAPRIDVSCEELEALLEGARAALGEAGYQKLQAAIRTLGYVTELLQNQEATLASLRRLLCHLRDVPLLISNRQLPDGLQGMLPLSAFAEFFIRLDIPGKSLDLLPYPAERAESRGALPAVSSNRLLFLKGTVNETHEGYFLLDTGTSYNAISRNMVRLLNISEALAALVPLQGGVAEVDAPLLTGLVRLRFPAIELVRGPIAGLDLSTASRYHNLRGSGSHRISCLVRFRITGELP
jgi:hypothetical protein